MPIVALDNVGTHPLICTHHIPVLFGIELAGQFGRVHHIAKHDGELAAFGFWCTCFAWRRHTLHGLMVLCRRWLCRLVRLRGCCRCPCDVTSPDENSPLLIRR